MVKRIAILLSTDSTIREAVTRCTSSIDHLRLEVRDSLEGVEAQLADEEVALLLTHLASNQSTPSTENELLRFVKSTANGVHTIVLSDNRSEERRVGKECRS